MSVRRGAVRQIIEPAGPRDRSGDAVRTADLQRRRHPGTGAGRDSSGIAAVLVRPEVTGWIRLRTAGSATTVRHQEGRTLLTDGPFIDSKEFLAGLIVVEAGNLDEALAVAAELQEQRPGRAGAIEVRPVLDGEVSGA